KSSSQYVNTVLNYSAYYKLSNELNIYCGAVPLHSYYLYNSDITYNHSSVGVSQPDYFSCIQKNYYRALGIGVQLSLKIELSVTKSFSILPSITRTEHTVGIMKLMILKTLLQNRGTKLTIRTPIGITA
ncbi:MAG: hypothetical protein AB1394_05950, partial [Bacteroidota bacterium]